MRGHQLTASRDTWSLDPAVGRLRKIFALLEARQAAVLARLTLSALDPRVRPARELARRLWEKAWANWQGSELKETRIADLYEYAFIVALKQQGIGPPLPEDWPDPPVRELFREVAR
jgi:hypothetical protein